MNKFALWVLKNDKKQSIVAKKIGMSPSSLVEILRNGRIPSIKFAHAIEIYTNGEIKVYDWLEEEKIVDDIAKTTNIKKTRNKKI
jgi:transcriptional regulator with XRE-family HTH domain